MSSEKKKAVIAAAIELFGNKGFDNTSTQSIAKHAGIGTGTLFKYFASKETLIREAYLQTKMEIIAACKADLDPMTDFASLLRTIWHNLLSWHLQNPLKHQFVMQIVSSRFCDAEIEELVDRELLFFKMAVKAAQDKGEVVPSSLELIQATIMNFLNMAIDFSTKPELGSEQEIFQLMLNSLKITPKGETP